MAPSVSGTRVAAVFAVLQLVQAYDMVPRWGHAAVYIPEPPSLLIHGGKTTQEPGQTYTSSPNSADLILLPLSNGFKLDAPPYKLLDNSAPAYAWHTLSNLGDKGAQVLSFGGDGGLSTPLPAGTDSAWILNSTSSSFTQQPSEWGGQPSRMIHHSAATAGDGKVYITGGQRNDGSGRILSDAYLFDGSTFSPLPSLPAGTSDHISTLLPNGTLVVLGGVQTEAATGNAGLAPMTSIYALDAGAEAWRTVQVGGEAPDARRGAVGFSDRGDRLIVMGGATVEQDEAMGDVWRLDLNNAVWSAVDIAEGGPSARFDFTATPIGNGRILIFGGYGSGGPVGPELFLYDIASNTWLDAFEPPTSPSITDTFPSQQSSSSATGSSADPSSPASGSSGPGGASGSGDQGQASTRSGSPDGTSTDTPADPTLSADNSHNLSTGAQVGMAVGIVSGVSLLAILAFLCLRRRRKRHNYRSAMLNEKGQDGEDRGLVPQWNEKSVVGLGLGAVSAGWTRISPHRRSTPYAPLKEEGMYTPPPARKSTRRIGNGVRLTGLRPPPSASGLRGAMSPPRRDMLSDEDSRTFKNLGRDDEGHWTLSRKDRNRASWAPANRVLGRKMSGSSGTDSGFDSDEESLLPAPRIVGGPVPTPMASASVIDPFDDSQSVDIGTIRSARSVDSTLSASAQRCRTGPGLHQLPTSEPMDFTDLLAVPDRYSYANASLPRSMSSRGSTYLSGSDLEEGVVHHAERGRAQYTNATFGIVSPDPNEGQPIKRSESFFKRMTAGGIAGLLGGTAGTSTERYATSGPAGPRSSAADVRDWRRTEKGDEPALWPVQSRREEETLAAHMRGAATGSAHLANSEERTGGRSNELELVPPPSAWTDAAGNKMAGAGQSVSSVATARSMRDFMLVQREPSGSTLQGFGARSGSGVHSSGEASSSGSGSAPDDRSTDTRPNAKARGDEHDKRSFDPFTDSSHTRKTSEGEEIIAFTAPCTPAALEMPSTPPYQSTVNSVNPYDVTLNPIPEREQPDISVTSCTPPVVELRHVSEDELRSGADEQAHVKSKQPTRPPSPPNGSPLAKAMISHRRPVRDMVSSINKRSSTRFAPGEAAAAAALFAIPASASPSPSSQKSGRTTKSQRSAKSAEESRTPMEDVVFSPASLYSEASPDLGASGSVPGPRSGLVTRARDKVEGRDKGVKWEVRRKESLIVTNPDRK